MAYLVAEVKEIGIKRSDNIDYSITMTVPILDDQPEVVILLTVFKKIAYSVKSQRFIRTISQCEYKKWLQECRLYIKTLHLVRLLSMFSGTFKQMVLDVICEIIAAQEDVPCSGEQMKVYRDWLDANPIVTHPTMSIVKDTDSAVIVQLFRNIGQGLKEGLSLPEAVLQKESIMTDLKMYINVLKSLLLFPIFGITCKEDLLSMFTEAVDVLSKAERRFLNNVTETRPIPETKDNFKPKSLMIPTMQSKNKSIFCDLKNSMQNNPVTDDVSHEGNNFLNKVRCELRKTGVPTCDLNLDGIQQPVTLEQIAKFERNNNLAIDVFKHTEGGEAMKRSKKQLVRLSSNVGEGARRIDLFFFENELLGQQKHELYAPKRRTKQPDEELETCQIVIHNSENSDQCLSNSEEESSQDLIDHDTLDPESIIEPTLSATWTLTSIFLKLFPTAGRYHIVKDIFFIIMLIIVFIKQILN